ncbi:hypothetical protein P7K49_012039 [Saguinus oedipus]|uniref:Uncharacterized protein n=1 Tax=Saguinus oedipus TaxID=9490 RepID=A0ABQ9VSD5_SAGOE|nr:hypothetical protein P7K49_012039 [Saguinus oedipus]
MQHFVFRAGGNSGGATFLYESKEAETARLWFRTRGKGTRSGEELWLRVPRCLAQRGRRSGEGLGYGGRGAAAAIGLRGSGAAMGNLFGRKKQSRVTEQDKAILVRPRAGAGAGAGGRPGGRR